MVITMRWMRRHHKLEGDIADALANSSTDDLTIVELKRQTLQLKDEIERLHREQSSFHSNGSAMR
jgi:hypothetical protein